MAKKICLTWQTVEKMLKEPVEEDLQEELELKKIDNIE
jgi:hypothetical protein